MPFARAPRLARRPGPNLGDVSALRSGPPSGDAMASWRPAAESRSHDPRLGDDDVCIDREPCGRSYGLEACKQARHATNRNTAGVRRSEGSAGALQAAGSRVLEGHRHSEVRVRPVETSASLWFRYSATTAATLPSACQRREPASALRPASTSCCPTRTSSCSRPDITSRWRPQRR